MQFILVITPDDEYRSTTAIRPIALADDTPGVTVPALLQGAAERFLADDDVVCRERGFEVVVFAMDDGADGEQVARLNRLTTGKLQFDCTATWGDE